MTKKKSPTKAAQEEVKKAIEETKEETKLIEKKSRPKKKNRPIGQRIVVINQIVLHDVVLNPGARSIIDDVMVEKGKVFYRAKFGNRMGEASSYWISGKDITEYK